MARSTSQARKRRAERARRVWALAARQHGVVALYQLLALGYTMSAVHHRISTGRLHPVRRGVYAVGRPQLTREGEWMAAILSCGLKACLSHESAAALWGIRDERPGPIHVTVPARKDRRQPGLAIHRRDLDPADRSMQRGIPVTAPIRTLMDLSTRVSSRDLEAAINEADKHDLVHPDRLRAAVGKRRGQRGVRPLRAILDRASFALTDSELERMFLPLVDGAGLPRPRTQCRVNGFRADFYWPELGLVVETDGLRYHRTAAQQGRDRVRDQRHTAAGLIPLRFTHAQVRFEPEYVQNTLTQVVAVLLRRRLGG